MQHKNPKIHLRRWPHLQPPANMPPEEYCHILRHQNRSWNYRPTHRIWPQRSYQATNSWRNALRTDGCHVFLSIHGPNGSMTVGSIVSLEIAPELEVKDPSHPEIPGQIFSLGRKSKVKIKAIISQRELTNQREGIYLYVATVERIRPCRLELIPPEGRLLPEHQIKQLKFPTRDVDIFMLYQPGQRQGDCQGVIILYDNYRGAQNNAHLEYIPDKFNVELDNHIAKLIT